MEQTITKNKFIAPSGDLLDVVYETSDGEIYIDITEARNAAKLLPQTSITTHYRDKHIRKRAEGHGDLYRAVILTDLMKRYKAKKQGPMSYADYVRATNLKQLSPLSEEIFNFIRDKVFRTTKPMEAGEKDTILSWRHGIVEAVFLRRYIQGQVWALRDELIMTCPTNTEIIGGTFQQIFSPFLDDQQ